MSVESNTELVRRYFECMRTFDGKGAEALLADNFTQFVPSPDPKFSTPKGKTETLAQMGGVAQMFESFDLKITGITAQGDRVAVEAESLGVLKPNGKTYNNRYHFLFEVENGRISKLKEYCDTKHAAEIFGL
jgi:ketosteroid isomerase-like protein